MLLLVGPGSLRRSPIPETVSRPTVDSLINVHGSPEYGLRLCGRTFDRVKGSPPYYLVIPQTPLLLFAYTDSVGGKTLVLCNTNDCTFREVSPGKVRFGERIGYRNATGGGLGDAVESVLPNKVVLISKSWTHFERSILDLESDTLHLLELESETSRIALDLGNPVGAAITQQSNTLGRREPTPLAPANSDPR